jgi:hypothetical protein
MEKVGDRTRAEWPLGERSTTWATPFQSLTASRPAEVVKWPMLIKREGGGEEAEHEGPLAGALSVRVKKG